MLSIIDVLAFIEYEKAFRELEHTQRQRSALEQPFRPHIDGGARPDGLARAAAGDRAR